MFCYNCENSCLGNTIYLGMDPDRDGTKWVDVKHPKRGLVLRVAKPKASNERTVDGKLFRAILEDRFRTEGNPEVSPGVSERIPCP